MFFFFLLQVIVFERGDLVFVFNFHPDNTYEGYAICAWVIYLCEVVCLVFCEVSIYISVVTINHR